MTTDLTMVSTQSNTNKYTKDSTNIEKDKTNDMANYNNIDKEKHEGSNEAAKNNKAAMTMTMTITTTSRTTDETQKKSDDFYVRTQQVMGTNEKIASERETLTDKLTVGENLNLRLSPPRDLNEHNKTGEDRLTDGENLNSSQSPSTDSDKPNKVTNGENLNPRLSPPHNLEEPNKTDGDKLTDGENLNPRLSPPHNLEEPNKTDGDKQTDGENLNPKLSQQTNLDKPNKITDGQNTKSIAGENLTLRLSPPSTQSTNIHYTYRKPYKTKVRR
jgi:hypothetical protein